MAKIEFSRDEKILMASKLQAYLRDELDQEIGEFDAEFLIDFIGREIGPYFYNRGLYDAQAIFQSKLDSAGEEIYAIEQPTAFEHR